MKKHFEKLMLLSRLLIILLLIAVLIDRSVIQMPRWDKPVQLLLGVVKNSYFTNIVCSLISVFALYYSQLKFCKYKIKKDFRVCEVVSGLYEGILYGRNLVEIKEYYGDDYYKFYQNNKAELKICHMILTYRDNKILIDSVQTIFFLNINFKLLNITNNIKNRVPTFDNSWTRIDADEKKYIAENSEHSLYVLNCEIKDFMLDMKFLIGYLNQLIIYLGFDLKYREFLPNCTINICPTFDFADLSGEEQQTICKKAKKAAKKITKLLNSKSVVRKDAYFNENYQQKTIDRINYMRNLHGLAPVKLDTTLCKMSEERALENVVMQTWLNDSLSHFRDFHKKRYWVSIFGDYCINDTIIRRTENICHGTPSFIVVDIGGSWDSYEREAWGDTGIQKTRIYDNSWEMALFNAIRSSRHGGERTYFREDVDCVGVAYVWDAKQEHSVWVYLFGQYGSLWG